VVYHASEDDRCLGSAVDPKRWGHLLVSLTPTSTGMMLVPTVVTGMCPAWKL
jgi:hypothetical protein